MRKYLFAIIFITIGSLLLAFSLLQKTKTVYPETIFAKEASSFDISFAQFMKGVEQNIGLIQNNFTDTNIIKDGQASTDFFINFLENNPYLISISFIQNNYKTGIYKDDKSYVIAMDSTKVLDIVQWHRYEKSKLISSWEESFTITIANTPWYQNLKNNERKIQWFFNVENDKDEAFGKDNELFFAGYSYSDGKTKNIILFRFSRFNLLKAFNTYTNFDNVNLLIRTSDGKKMDLSAGITETFEQVGNRKSNEDSLSINTLHHFERFSDLDSGIFNFSFNNNIYWNSFKRFPTESGILYYLLSIPNSDIILKSEKKASSSYFLWIAILLITLGLLSLFIRKDRFIRSNKIKIPSVKEILEDDENRYLEFKSSLRWDYRQEKVNPELEKVIFKTIAAFGNTDGGILLIGVDDDKNILGLEPDFNSLKKPNADFFEIHLRNLLHTLMGVKYVSKNLRMQFEDCDDNKTVCKIKVIAANEALYLKSKNKNGQVEEKFYVRSGNSSQEIKPIAEITDYINSRFK